MEPIRFRDVRGRAGDGSHHRRSKRDQAAGGDDNGGEDGGFLSEAAPEVEELELYDPSHPLSPRVLRCGDGVTMCRPITCTLGLLRANESVVVRVRSRLWNATLTEEFSAEAAVMVEARARQAAVLRGDRAI